MPVFCFGKRFQWRLRGEGESPGKGNESRSDDLDDRSSSPELRAVTSQQPDGLWMRAERLLQQDPKTNKILTASAEILETRFQLNVQTNGVAGQEQLSSFLDTKSRELTEKKWVVKLGNRNIGVEEQLTRAFQNVLMVRDVINIATAANPPAAIACAGVTVSLLFVVQAAEQHACLLQGLEATSALIPRLHVMEDLYMHPEENPSIKLMGKFKEDLVLLYSKILEFQARALCYLHKHSVSRLFRNMFMQDAWDKLLQDIERLENSALKFISLIESAGYRQRLEDIQSTLYKIEVWSTTSTRDGRMKSFFHRLYTCPYQDRKDRNSKRVPGTCDWFTSHAQFQNWEQSDHSSLLWVSADPGCGKSVLTRYLVDDFLPNPARTVCYFFFKDDFPDQKRATSALSAILRQLFMAQPHLLSDSTMDKLDTDGENLIGSFNGLWNILMSVAARPNIDEILCVVDALDECQDDDRKQLIQAVRNFYSVDTKEHNLKFLITSRPYDHIRRGFQELEDQLPTIHLSGEGEAEIEKISQEIDLVIEKRVEDIGTQNSLRPDELTYLQKQLTSVPNRTYLWVSLTLDVIENISGFTKGNIRRVLHDIPQSIDDAYNRILNRSSDSKKAERLLHIVTVAKRPLSLGEVSVALAFSAGGQQSMEDITDDIETDGKRIQRTVRDLCGLFLVVIDSKVYLLHQTAKEFLVQTKFPEEHAGCSINTWKHSLQPEKSHRILAEICTSYLTQGVTENPLNIFLDYAACNWASHFHAAKIQSGDLIAKRGYILCETGSKIYDTWSVTYVNNTYPYPFPTNSSPLIMSSYLGFAIIVHQLLDTRKVDVDSKDSIYAQTPLSWAAQNGHEEVVKLLLRTKKVDVDSKNKSSQTPLSLAAQNGHEMVVKLLLNTEKMDVDSKNNFDQTPLSWAAKHGHEKVVKLLLNTGKVIVNSKDSFDRAPLSLAAQNGHEKVVKLLLHTEKADVDSKDSLYAQTPLSWAAQNGHEKVVKLLLHTKKVDVDSKNNSCQTPLSLAAEKGHEKVVKLLLHTGKVDVDSKSILNKTPLSFAARYGYDAVMKLLLHTEEVYVDSKDTSGQTPLSLAAQNGYEAAVKLLLTTEKVDVDSKSDFGQTPLSLAAQNGHEAVVKLLLHTGKVDISFKNGFDQTPLSLAVQNGHVVVAKLLLDITKDVDSKDTSDQTPLSWAARFGYDMLVKLLLGTKKVDVDTKDNYGQTPLSLAAEHGHESVVKMLLDIKKNVNLADNSGQTPLSWAARNGHEPVVKLLLDTGMVDVSSKDIYDLTPPSWAARNGYDTVVKLLLEPGKLDVDSC